MSDHLTKGAVVGITAWKIKEEGVLLAVSADRSMIILDNGNFPTNPTIMSGYEKTTVSAQVVLRYDKLFKKIEKQTKIDLLDPTKIGFVSDSIAKAVNKCISKINKDAYSGNDKKMEKILDMVKDAKDLNKFVNKSVLKKAVKYIQAELLSRKSEGGDGDIGSGMEKTFERSHDEEEKKKPYDEERFYPNIIQPVPEDEEENDEEKDREPDDDIEMC